MTIKNHAAWQRRPGEPLAPGPSALRDLRPGEILVRNEAVAINPLDPILQDVAALPWLTYPAITGSDVAGRVVAVGAGVDRFRVGDRVLGQAVGTTVDDPAQGAFQEHTVVLDHMASPIPEAMAATEAAVLPLGLGTAASGLYQAGHLGLRHPTGAPVRDGGALLVWGASSSVGANAVQLATASGYDVVATASPRNAALVRALGAVEVLDHAGPDAVERVAAALEGRRLVGAFHATGDLARTFEVVRRSEGRRVVAVTLPLQGPPPEGVEAAAIAGTSLKDDAVGPMLYCDHLPAALAAGRHVAAPPPRVVGRGLEAVQRAVDLQRRGVSGHKLVVDLT